MVTPTSSGQDEKWEEILVLSLDSLRTFLSAEEVEPKDLAKAKIANTFVSSYARNKATQSSDTRTRVIVGRELAQNPEQFREFMQLNAPHIPLPALPEPKAETS